MRSINYCPPPVEHIPDLTDCGILGDYELRCEEYPGAWEMREIMKTFNYCDYSIPLDDFHYSNGIIFSDWVIYFTCRPTDAERLVYISTHLKRYIRIYDAEGNQL